MIVSIVEDFLEVRRDGKIIPETMTVEQMVAQGWSSERIVQIRWRFDDRDVSLANEHGLLTQVTPRRDGVVVIGNQQGGPSTLAVINGDGSTRLVIDNQQRINGRQEAGVFSWFEPCRTVGANCFGAVFRTQSAMYQVDIDADTGHVLGVTQSI
jgi:hypothetical protein